MAESSKSSSSWEEIEQSESYLVCSSFEEAASLASSVLERIRTHNEDASNEDMYDMMESAGMVFVQSMKGIGRTADILQELKLLFASVADIPVQVLLTGACFQISEGCYNGVREFLEEFLAKWNYADERYYVVINSKKNADSVEEFEGHFVLEIDQYLDVVELYTITLLGTAMNNLDLAISWTEKASLPNEKRQILLRKLRALKVANTSQPPEDQCNSYIASGQVKSQKASNASYPSREEKVPKQTIMNSLKQTHRFFFWFRPITLKLGENKIVLSNGKVLLGCLILIACYTVRRKRAALKSMVTGRILSMKKALVDLWQLAFSYQVNPLAAVQPLPSAPARGGR